MPCEYDSQRGGFPLAVLERPQPAEFQCVACQLIARDAVTACKGLCPSRIHTSPPCKATGLDEIFALLSLLRCRGPSVL